MPSGCLGIFLKLFKIKPEQEETVEEYPYQKRLYLMTKAERSFYGILVSCCSEQHLIFSKVRLADLISVKSGTHSWRSYFNKIQSKHVDFLIVSKNSISPLLVIELDDSSHQRPDRIKRDLFMDEALRAAGIPILRVKTSKSYSLNEISDKISSFGI